MTDGMESMGGLGEQAPELRAHYSLQQLPQIVEALAPHLPDGTLQEFVRIADEVTERAAESIGIDPTQFTAE